jgi:hypothetical protein
MKRRLNTIENMLPLETFSFAILFKERAGKKKLQHN